MNDPRSIAELIAEQRCLAELPNQDHKLIAGCGKNVHFRSGEMLFREGDAADTFYLVRRGSVAIELAAPARPPIVISTAGEGGLVGWSWLFPPYRWHFDARAREEVSAIAIDGACLRGKCEDDNALGYRLMRCFAQVAVDHLQAARMQVLDLYGNAG